MSTEYPNREDNSIKTKTSVVQKENNNLSLQIINESPSIDIQKRAYSILKNKVRNSTEADGLRLRLDNRSQNPEMVVDTGQQSDIKIVEDELTFYLDQYIADLLDMVKIDYLDNTLHIQYSLKPGQLDLNACDITQENCGPDCC